MNLLLVEDNFLAAAHLIAVLRQLGHEVIGPLATAEQALQAIETHHPEAAILDFRIRGGTAEPVAQALADRGCPFCFLTGCSDPELIPPAFRHVLRLSKPFHEAELARTLTSFADA